MIIYFVSKLRTLHKYETPSKNLATAYFQLTFQFLHLSN